MTTRDVTGRWDGIFNYPRELPPNGFVAVLVEHAGTITGETEEASDRRSDQGAGLPAMIEGERVGTAVRFVKRYDDRVRAHAVHYAGTVSPEGDEIVGEWTIPAVWSGSFIMVRQPDRVPAVEQAVGAEVR